MLKKLKLFNYCLLQTNKYKFHIACCILLNAVLLMSSLQTNAQRFPVQVNQSLVSPYSSQLNSYATTNEVKLRLFLTLTDINVSNREVKLKLKMQGQGLNFQSTENVTGAPATFLSGGAQQQLTNLDLAPYFQLNNLVGINPQQYSRPLPSGSYTLCWEVYDAITNQLISNPNLGCTTFFLVLNDPPFLNLPSRGEQLSDVQPTNIIFQWTPRHVNATNVSYEFELREIWDEQIDPQAGFLASPPYHTETTFATTLLYNLGKPQLFPGRTYGWRVRAISTSGLSENAVFKNDGYSEIFHFTFTDQCAPPTYTLAEPLSASSVRINWQGIPNHNKFHVQYKRADVPDAEWFDVFTYNTQAQISNLQEGVTYEFRVGGTCYELSDFNPAYVYSNVNQFTMPTGDDAITYSCGIVPDINITNTTSLSNLGINETFTAGDFPVTVKQIQGANGVFSGTGFIIVPYLTDTKIAVEFSGIRINSDYQLFDGMIITTYDPNWSGVEDIGDLIGGGAGDIKEFEINFPIADLPEGIQIDDNGDILIVGVGGQPVVEYPGGSDYIFTDASDPPKTYSVDEEGNVTYLGEQAPGGASTAENTNGVDSNGNATSITADGVVVTFTALSPTSELLSRAGFDAYNPDYPKTKSLYRNLGTNYTMPYKAVAKQSTDYIIASYAISNDSIQPEDLIFKTKEGVRLTKVDSTETSYTLELLGTLSDADIETQAVVEQDSTYQIAGAFVQYQSTPLNLDLVLVNTAGINTDAVKEDLQRIYQQAMVNINITEVDDFSPQLDLLAPDGTIDSGESGFLANYTAQQQDINAALNDRPDYRQSAYYLILTDKTSTKSGQNGLMPVGRQFGYVYTSNCSTADCIPRTAAHELGHGAFQLKHPFSELSYAWNEGDTNWLMDYSNAEHLPYVHWKAIHNPEIRIGIFDDDEEGELIEDEEAFWNYVDSEFSPQNPEWNDFLEKLKKIEEFFENCQEQDWKAHEDGGIIPICLWEDTVPLRKYTMQDPAFLSGIIDGENL